MKHVAQKGVSLPRELDYFATVHVVIKAASAYPAPSTMSTATHPYRRKFQNHSNTAHLPAKRVLILHTPSNQPVDRMVLRPFRQVELKYFVVKCLRKSVKYFSGFYIRCW